MEKKQKMILSELLKIDQVNAAQKLNFIKKSANLLPYDLAVRAIGVLNTLSKINDEESRKLFISIAALLWEHRSIEYDGLKDILILLLSRIGYAPSSIILDEKYNAENGRFSPLISLVSQIEASFNQQKYEIKIKDKVFLLTAFQQQIWQSIDENNVIGISAPTSAGKSFILLLKAIIMLMEYEYDIIYIVPTLSLVNQVTEDFIKILKKFKWTRFELVNSYNVTFDSDKPKIYILTQEKAIAAFSISDTPFFRKSLLIIDEIQNIERVSEENDEMRSKILYDTINEFRYISNIVKIVISGPRIDNIDTLGSKLFGKKNSQRISTNVSPVLNITYSIEKRKTSYYFKQYCDLFDEPNSILIENSKNIIGHKQKLYTEEFKNYLVAFVKNLGINSKNIIFSPNPKQARESAIAIANEMPKKESEKIQSLSKYLQDSVRANYMLGTTIESGVAYHHGKLPSHVRKVVEKAACEKVINNIVCTTTLMQGINLPAQNVIIRNPHLYLSKKPNSAELSSYEMANLRGRAGRLLKDFIGRTFVLDENEFLDVTDEYEQINLFENTYKKLETSYESKYEKNKSGVYDAIDNSTPSNLLPSEYRFLVIYLRQTILRHGKKALERLRNVGINLPTEKYKKILNDLEKINVDKEICMQNRYWDPLVLDKLFKDKILPDVPTSVQEKGIARKLRAVLKYLRDSDDYKDFFESHIKNGYRSGLKLTILCELTEKWLKGKTLHEILIGPYYDNPDKIDDTIGLLQNTISFDIPLLLRPIYHIKHKNNMFLTFIETGAYKPITRKLIEIGIPRETAIYLSGNYFKDVDCSDEYAYDNIQSEIKRIIDALPYWVKAQLEFIS